MPQLRSTDNQLFDLSEPAARLSVFVQYALDDVADGAPVLVELGAASLARVVALLERTVAVVEVAPEERTQAELRMQGLPRGATLDDDLRVAAEAALDAALGVVSLLDVSVLLRDLERVDAPLPMTMLAERFARLLRGRPAAALRGLLGVADGDFLSAAEMSAVLAEPLCAPAAAAAAPAAAPALPEPPPLARSVSLAMGESGQDFVSTARPCLERCDARTLRELKAVSAAWQRRAREVLCDAASAWRRQPIWSPSAEGRALAARLGGGSARERREVLRRMGRQLDRVVDLPGHALAVVSLLEDSDAFVRTSAVETLGKLEPAALAQHGAALVARLEHSKWVVRKVAVKTLGKLEPAALAQHGAALAARLEDSDVGVSHAAVETLGKLEPAALAQHGAALAARLADSVWKVRQAAVETLGKLDLAALAQHGAALVARLEDSNEYVRQAVVQTLGTLEPAVLAQHEQAIAKAAEEDEDGDVRGAAAELLAELRAGQ